jgi:hypothetical protein
MYVFDRRGICTIRQGEFLEYVCLQGHCVLQLEVVLGKSTFLHGCHARDSSGAVYPCPCEGIQTTRQARIEKLVAYKLAWRGILPF